MELRGERCWQGNQLGGNQRQGGSAWTPGWWQWGRWEMQGSEGSLGAEVSRLGGLHGSGISN